MAEVAGDSSVPGQAMSFEQATAYLATDDVSSKAADNNVKQAIEAVIEHGQDIGLDHDGLLTVVSLIVKSSLGVRARERLVKALIPRSTVPVQAVLNSVVRFNTVAADRDVYVKNRRLQALMLKWTVAVYNLIDNLERLHSLYGVLFLYLEYETLRGDICHLLYLLTRKKDVVPFRIRKLLALQQHVGHDPAIYALLASYKRSCPHLVSLVPMKTARKMWFPRIDQDWLRAIRHHQGADYDVNGTMSVTITAADRQRGKRMRGLAVPSVTAGTIDHLDTNNQSSSSIDVGEIKSFDKLTKSIDAVNLPSQIAAVLQQDQDVLRSAVLYTADTAVINRLDYWLAATLTQLVSISPCTVEVQARLAHILQQTLEVCKFLHTTLPGVDRFLVQYLPRWNGVFCRGQILSLVSLMPPQSFIVLHQDVLKPLYFQFTCGNTRTRCMILECFTNILARYAEFDWVGYYSPREERTRPENSWHDILPLAEEANYIRSMYDLADYIDGVCGVATVLERYNTAVYHEIISFYRYASRLKSKFGLPLTVVPSQSVVYSCLLNPTLDVVSRFCEVLDSMYRECKKSSSYTSDLPLPSSRKEPYGDENKEYFTFYVPDATATLWFRSALPSKPKNGSILYDAPVYTREKVATQPDRSKALSSMRTTFRDMIITAISKTVPQSKISGSLDITRLFAGFARRYLVAMQKKTEGKADHIKLKTELINKKDHYRQVFLEHLKKLNATGLYWMCEEQDKRSR